LSEILTVAALVGDQNKRKSSTQSKAEVEAQAEASVPIK